MAQIRGDSTPQFFTHDTLQPPEVKSRTVPSIESVGSCHTIETVAVVDSSVQFFISTISERTRTMEFLSSYLGMGIMFLILLALVGVMIFMRMKKKDEDD
ncbi:hypothetical protein [Fimbriiglobus ruber]|uniref:hypothetical protein n=1 Tax=Fimbriiglobus ruber TaxID=1908690 RepID=UPI000B4B82FB|nr:hypothetical protein [Fimbriiglobus ruber]